MSLGEAELKKRTFTNLYNQRPTWLDLAHKKLDAAVLDAYRWPPDLSDEDILERKRLKVIQFRRGGALPLGGFALPAQDAQCEASCKDKGRPTLSEVYLFSL